MEATQFLVPYPLSIVNPRLTELLSYIERERADLQSAVQLVPPDERSIRPSESCWSVAEILEHLATVEHGVTRLFEKRLAEARANGLGAELDTSPILPRIDRSVVLDRSRTITAPERTRPSGTVDAESAWTALSASRQKFLGVLASADGLALGELVHPHPVLGDIDFYAWIAFIGAHENRHAQQIREMAGSAASEPAS